MKFGVFGCRHLHIEIAVSQLLALGFTCVGIYETECPLAKKLAGQYHLKLIASEHEFFTCKPDIVLCAAVNSRKIDVIEKCVTHGANVMLDKPLVTSFEDYARLKRVINLHKIKIGLMLTERFNPSVYTLKSLIDHGILGKPIGFAFNKPHKLTPTQRENWHFDKKQNGGPVIDLVVHDIDLIRWFTGSEIQKITGYMRKGDHVLYPQLFDDAKLLVLMKNGVTATMAADWWTPDAFPCFGNGRIICTGTLGKCEVYTTGEPLIQKKEFAVLSTDAIPEKVVSCLTPPKNLMEDFLERIVGRPSVVRETDICKATYESLIADQNCKIIEV